MRSASGPLPFSCLSARTWGGDVLFIVLLNWNHQQHALDLTALAQASTRESTLSTESQRRGRFDILTEMRKETSATNTSTDTGKIAFVAVRCDVDTYVKFQAFSGETSSDVH